MLAPQAPKPRSTQTQPVALPSSVSGDSEEQDTLFRDASSRSRRPQLAELAERHQGRLYDQAVEKLSQFLGERGGPGGKASMSQWVTYLQSVLLGKTNGAGVPPDRLKEMKTLCEVLNLLGEGKLAVAADVLMQRFKSLE